MRQKITDRADFNDTPGSSRLRKNSLGTPELRWSAHEGKQEYST